MFHVILLPALMKIYFSSHFSKGCAVLQHVCASLSRKQSDVDLTITREVEVVVVVVVDALLCWKTAYLP